ncbi:MAG: tetratricopeptide repeat protein [Chitinophagaceae bacterium]
MKIRWIYGLLFLAFWGLTACQNKPETSNEKVAVAKPEEIVSLDEAIEKNPNQAELYFKRGIAWHKAGNDSLALSDFNNAVQRDSMQAKYYSAIGDLMFEHKDISGSIPWIQRAIALNPNDEVAHLKMAKMFFYTEDYPKAFAEINTVLRGNVYNAEAYFLKGMCYKGMKDTNKAISSFQTAVQTEPKMAEAHMQLALLFEARRDPLALNYFENAYRADSSNLEPLYGQGMFWQNQEKYTEAKKVFQRIISLDRTYPTSYYNIGWMLLQEDSTEKAARFFSMAIQEKPDYAEAYYNRGLCYEIQGDVKKASDDYDQALVFNPALTACVNAKQRLQVKK